MSFKYIIEERAKPYDLLDTSINCRAGLLFNAGTAQWQNSFWLPTSSNGTVKGGGKRVGLHFSHTLPNTNY